MNERKKDPPVPTNHFTNESRLCFVTVFTVTGRSQEELEARKARGEDVGVMAQFGAMKAVMGRLQTEMKKDRHMMRDAGAKLAGVRRRSGRRAEESCGNLGN